MSAETSLSENGFTIVERLIDADAIPALRAEADALLQSAAGRGGARNVLGKSRIFRELATDGPPAALAARFLGSESRPTKLTVFDKTPQANWKVPWHQDLTIAVAQRKEVPNFGPWSIKDGIVHVQPPVPVLEQILAIRLHLDDTPATNGALRVLPGTHRLGRVAEPQIAALREKTAERVCPVSAGGAMLMRPLLLHASSPSNTPNRRRVLHFEYSLALLPAGLLWA